MTKIYCTLFLLFTATLNLNAQALSLDQLIYLRNKDVDAVNSYLSPKGWVFHDATEETEREYGNSTWAHGKQLYSTRAKSFLKLLAADGYNSKVSYLTASKVYYEAVRSKVLAYKMVKLSSTAKDGYITTVYLGTNYLVETRLSTDSDTSIPVYGVTVSRKPPLGYQSPASELATVDASEEEGNSPEVNEAAPAADDSAGSEASEEVLLPEQLERYKQRITATYSSAPPASDFMYLAEITTEASDLIADVNTPGTVYRRLVPSDRVFVLSHLLGEDHNYYLVYAGGYYGYVDRSSLQRFSR